MAYFQDQGGLLPFHRLQQTVLAVLLQRQQQTKTWSQDHRRLLSRKHDLTRHLERDHPEHHVLSHRLPQNLDTRGAVGEIDLNLFPVVLTVETEKIGMGGLDAMIETMMHAHARHQSDAHLIDLAGIESINLATGHLGLAVIVAA